MLDAIKRVVDDNFCLPARQCTDASCVQHSSTAAVQNFLSPELWSVQSLGPLT